MEEGSPREFDYSTVPLDASREQIRLISFPSPDWRKIQCNLQVFSLRDAPRYAALSYVWGDATTKVQIRCNDNGDYVNITENLINALANLAYQPKLPFLENEYEWIWADAISINQRDLQERESQVLIMRQIYERADHTFIWLGAADPKIRQAFDFISAVAVISDTCKAANDFRSIEEMNPQERNDYGISESWFYLESGNAESLSHLSQLPWFHRVWSKFFAHSSTQKRCDECDSFLEPHIGYVLTLEAVIQELAVSKRPVLISAPHQLDWTTFVKGFLFACSHSLIRFPGIPHLEELMALRQGVEARTPLPLLSLLVFGNSFESTDPRDKVYALLGLSYDSVPDHLDIRPDYSIPFISVYRKVAKAMMIQNSRLDLLNVPRGSKGEETLDLPSWVPDWRLDHQSSTSYISRLLSSHSLFTLLLNVGSPYAATPAIELDNELDNKPFLCNELSIQLSGFAIGSIQALGAASKHQNTTFTSFREVMRLVVKSTISFVQWDKLCRDRFGDRYGPTDETMKDAWGRTISAGLNAEDLGLDAGARDVMRGFSEWYEHLKPVPFLPRSRFSALLRASFHLIKIPFESTAERHSSMDLHAFTQALEKSEARRFFCTEGFMGIGHPAAQKHDEGLLA